MNSEIENMYIILAMIYIGVSLSTVSRKHINILRYALLGFSTMWIINFIYSYIYALQSPFERFMFEQQYSGSFAGVAWFFSFGIIPQFLWVPKIHKNVGIRIALALLSIIYPCFEIGIMMYFRFFS